MTETEKEYRRRLKSLSCKQQKLVHEYLIDGNATRAAKVVGYAPKSAHESASEALQKPELRLAYQAGLAAIAERCEVTADKIIKELASIAFSTPYSFAPTEDGFGVTESASPESGAALEVRHRRYTKGDGTVETETIYTQQDKIKALELLGKKLKLFVDRVEVDNPQDQLFRMMIQKLKDEQK